MSGFLAKVNSRAASTTRQTTGQSSVARTAAKNIRSSSTATGNVSGLRTSGRDFGIFAQRSVTGSGAQYDVKGYNSASLSAYRHSMNDNHTQVYNNFGFGGYTSNSSNGLNKFAAAMMAMGVLGDLANQAVTAVKSTKTSSSQGTGKTPSTGDADVAETTQTSSLSEMKNADNTTTLEAAIEKAKTDQKAIPGRVSSAKADLSNLKNNQAGLDKKAEETKQALDANTAAIEKTSENINTLNNEIPGLETRKSSLEGQISAAEATSQNGGTPTVNVSQLKQQLQQVTEQLDKKKEDLQKAQEDLKKYQGETDKLKQAASDASEAATNNKSGIDAKQKELEQLQKDQKELDSEITKQEKRLEELTKKENNELDGLTKSGGKIDALTKDITKLKGSIDLNDEDGYSEKDKKTDAKIKNKQGELDRLNQRKTELQKRKAIREQQGENHNGILFKSLNFAGQQLYIVDGKEVSQDEYNQKLDDAKKQKS